MEGLDVPDGPLTDEQSVCVPVEADFLYAFSTVPGYYSWRNSTYGSWFIQSLIKVFEENAKHMDILQMLTRVNAILSTRQSQTFKPFSSNKKQIASIVSMLRKELYFFPDGSVHSQEGRDNSKCPLFWSYKGLLVIKFYNRMWWLFDLIFHLS